MEKPGLMQAYQHSTLTTCEGSRKLGALSAGISRSNNASKSLLKYVCWIFFKVLKTGLKTLQAKINRLLKAPNNAKKKKMS